jgi:tetratricopeptide (TPR) repeat protein
MRKSIKVAPGIRLNVSKRGVGMSAGAGGLRYSAHSSGRRTVTARSGIPGVYYQQSRGGGRRRAQSAPRATGYAPAVPAPVKPGLFAPKGEKALFKAMKAGDVGGVLAAGERNPAYKLPAFTLAGLVLAGEDGDRALKILEEILNAGDAAESDFFKKYVHDHAELKIAEGVMAYVPLGRDAVGLTLAELYQSENRLQKAIAVVEQLEPSTYTAVSLARFYIAAGQHEDAIDVTEGIENVDDATALLLVFRAVAFRERKLYDAAHEVFKQALRSRSRDPVIRHHALYERALNYLAQGKQGMAKKDLERILADDSDYPGVQEQLEELSR